LSGDTASGTQPLCPMRAVTGGPLRRQRRALRLVHLWHIAARPAFRGQKCV